jgi:hypothetical protein
MMQNLPILKRRFNFPSICTAGMHDYSGRQLRVVEGILAGFAAGTHKDTWVGRRKHPVAAYSLPLEAREAEFQTRRAG